MGQDGAKRVKARRIAVAQKLGAKTSTAAGIGRLRTENRLPGVKGALANINRARKNNLAVKRRQLKR